MGRRDFPPDETRIRSHSILARLLYSEKSYRSRQQNHVAYALVVDSRAGEMATADTTAKQFRNMLGCKTNVGNSNNRP